MTEWFYVRVVDGTVELDVFPMTPGGVTLRVSCDVAEGLAKRLREAAAQLRREIAEASKGREA